MKKSLQFFTLYTTTCKHCFAPIPFCDARLSLCAKHIMCKLNCASIPATIMYLALSFTRAGLLLEILHSVQTSHSNTSTFLPVMLLRVQAFAELAVAATVAETLLELPGSSVLATPWLLSRCMERLVVLPFIISISSILCLCIFCKQRPYQGHLPFCKSQSVSTCWTSNLWLFPAISHASFCFSKVGAAGTCQ